MTVKERERSLMEMAESNKNPWIPVSDIAEGYHGGYVWVKLWILDSYRYQAASWIPDKGFIPVIWADSTAKIDLMDIRPRFFKNDDGVIAEMIEEQNRASFKKEFTCIWRSK